MSFSPGFKIDEIKIICSQGSTIIIKSFSVL